MIRFISIRACGLAMLGISFTSTALEPSEALRVTPLLKTTTTWNGEPIVYPQGTAEITALIIELAPGSETGRHAHPVPSFAVVLEGELEVTLDDGQSRRFKAGDALAEVVDTIHNGRNVGDTPVRLVVFYAGTQGQTLTTSHADDVP